MKKSNVFVFFIFVLLICAILPSMAYARANTRLTLEYDGKQHNYNAPEITLIINNTRIDNSQLSMPPVILDNRTYVPVRAIFESMGAVVDWKQETGEVFIGYDGSLIVLRINDKNIYIDGTPKQTDVPPRIVNGRTMVPVKFISEAIGFNVDWNENTRTVSLNNTGIFMPESPENEPTADTDDDPLTVLPSQKQIKAIDVSKSAISAVDLPETKITGITLPSSAMPNEFIISANSGISKVVKTTVGDDRLVLDIYNAELSLPKSEYAVSGNSFVARIRTGQNQITPEKISRIVFDLTESFSYSISISDDRKQITVRLEQNKITNISFSTDGEKDYIYITGETAPVISMFTLGNPMRLVIDLPLGLISEDSLTNEGVMTSSIRTGQFEPSVGRIAVDLKSMPDYTSTSSGNVTTVIISKPTYFNIGYDYDNKKIVIPKSAIPYMNANSFLHNDEYNKLKYTLILDGDYSNELGYGLFNIKDSLINSVEIRTVNGRTQLSINENTILAYKITETESEFCIIPVNPKEIYSKVLVLDPGHGGKFPGSSGNGIIEKELNLKIAQKVLNLLEADGRIKVYMTRLDDVHLADELSAELLKRSAIANSIGDLFVSIHNNSFTPASNGTETYYCVTNNNSVGGINSAKAAEIIQRNMLKYLGSYDRKVKTDDFSVLRYNKIPSVLVEVGFLTNVEEASKLATNEYQDKAAAALFESIIEIFEIYTPSR